MLTGTSAFVWMNYASEDPRTFQSVAMEPVVPSNGHQRAFEVRLPAAVFGTSIITAYLVVGDKREWASTWYGTRNLVLRVSSPDIDGLYLRQVPIDKANARADSTDWFSIDLELSLEARRVPRWDLDLRHQLAIEVMRRFVAEAHERGMKVIFDVALNHVGTTSSSGTTSSPATVRRCAGVTPAKSRSARHSSARCRRASPHRSWTSGGPRGRQGLAHPRARGPRP